MPIPRSVPLLLTAALLLLSGPMIAADKAKEKPTKITLEDVIFDENYLKKALGPKTLLTFEKPTAEIPADLAQAITKAGFDQGTKFMVLPPEVAQATLADSIPYNFPQSMRRGRSSGRADFLVFIGADGAVKTIYCYNQTHRMFAVAVAAAVVRWKYEPVKIQGQAVPVLLVIGKEFKGANADSMIDMNPARTPIPAPHPTTRAQAISGGS